MFVDYLPEGQAPQRFEFDPGRIRLGESAAIETAYSKLVGEGKTIQHFLNDVRQGSAAARRLLLHRLLRKQLPTLRFDDVDPYEDEVKVTFSRGELVELRATIEKTRSISDADKEQMLAKLDEEIADAEESERDQLGKATGTSTPATPPSESSGESTS